MATTKILKYSIEINADADKVFSYVTDWRMQSDWVPFTDVQITSGLPCRLGSTLAARTRIGPLGFTDTMIITQWKPPLYCKVNHTGKIVRGDGIFSVETLPENKSKFIWQEVTLVPFGAIGRVGLFCLQPLFRLLFNYSLAKLRTNIER